jgi:hypothetical protein
LKSGSQTTAQTTAQITPQTTVGMTYPIATGSNNLLQTLEDKLGLSSSETTNPQTTTPTPTHTPTPIPTPAFMITASLPTDLNSTSGTSNSTLPSKTQSIEEHPSILDENNAIVSKCRRDAMRNSEKIQKTATTTPTTTIAENTATTTTTGTTTLAITNVIYEYRTAFYSLLVIVLLAILGFVAYKWLVPEASS